MNRPLKRILTIPLLFIAMFIYGAGQEYYNDVIKPRVNPAPTIRSTYITPTPRPFQYQTSTPYPTINPCTPGFFVFPSDENRTICVYGNLIRQQFIPYNSTVRLYVSYDPPFFFLCENCYFPDLEPGDCISARGLIQLTTDKQPFINVTQQSLKNCN